MATRTNNNSTEATTESTRVVGNQLPGHLLGRPRTFWVEAMAPKQSASIFELDQFDLHAIIDELHYGTDCDWAA